MELRESVVAVRPCHTSATTSIQDPNPRDSKIKKIWESWSLEMHTDRDHLNGKDFLDAAANQQLLDHLDVRMQTPYDM